MSDARDWELDTYARLRNLSRAVTRYGEAATLPREIAWRLLDRLGYIRIEPQRVVNIGSRLGECGNGLQERFPEAAIVDVDIPAMLAAARPAGRRHEVAALLPRLPFCHGAFDLIVSNLELCWSWRLTAALEAMRDVLAPGGLLMFTTLGPDTLLELRSSWMSSDTSEHVHGFYDMHDIGDALVRAGFVEPVMDTERITVNYPQVHRLLDDLRAMGAQNVLINRRRSLTGVRRYRAMIEDYERLRDHNGMLPATCEVIYGHAWGPAIAAPRRRAGRRAAGIPVQLVTGGDGA